MVALRGSNIANRRPAAHRDVAGGALSRRLRAATAGVVLLAGIFAAAVSTGALAAEPVRVRAITADGYGHITFEKPGSLPYYAQLEGSRLVIHFREPVTGPLDPVVRSLPEYVDGFGLEDEGRTVVYQLKGRYRLQTSTLPNAILIELHRQNSGQAQTDDRPFGNVRPRAQTSAEPPTVTPAPVTTVSSAPLAEPAEVEAKKTKPDRDAADWQPVGENRAVGEVTVALDDDGDGSKSGRRKGAADMPADWVATIPLPEAPGDKKRPPQFVTNDPPLAVHPFNEPRGKGFGLRFDWEAPVGAAVFRLGGHIWVVFNQARHLDLSRIRKRHGPVAASLEQVSTALGTVARLEVPPEVNAQVSRTGNTWVVSIRRISGMPATAMPIEVQPHAAAGPRVLLPIGDAYDPMLLDAATIGETVFVVPTQSPGVGIRVARAFPQFQVLASNQGVAVLPRADGVAVSRVHDGIEITASGGLMVSNQAEDKREARWPGDRRPVPRLFDFEAWRRGGADRFIRAKQKLLSELASATRSEADLRRVALAQFYFANGMASDAIGTLRLVGDTVPISREPAFKALLGAIALMIRDFDRADRYLMDSELDGKPEATLWRGVLRARQRDWREAVKHFSTDQSLLRFYDAPFRVPFTLLAARANLEVKDAGGAGRYLDLLNDDDLSSLQAGEMAYLRGWAVHMAGNDDAALQHWDKAIAAAAGSARVEATVARTALLTARGEEPFEEAIQKLERLRFAWRGDEIEFSILRLLASLYLEKKKFRLGLESLRRAVKLYPHNADTPVLGKEMADMFATIFVDGGTGNLSPIEAIGLYDDFRDLTPPGRRGDVLIRELAERLVSVDLLGRAADLLADLAQERLLGAEKAQVGSRLAAIYLLDKKPQQALDSLAMTHVDVVPEEIRLERKRMEARGLWGLGHSAAALSKIADDASDAAELLRAEVHWKAGNWVGAARALGRVADTMNIVDGKLDEAQSRLILSWASALALSNDNDGLILLRRRFDAIMEASEYRDAYRVVASDRAVNIRDYRTLVARVREVDHYASFLSAYREHLAGRRKTQ